MLVFDLIGLVRSWELFCVGHYTSVIEMTMNANVQRLYGWLGFLTLSSVKSGKTVARCNTLGLGDAAYIGVLPRVKLFNQQHQTDMSACLLRILAQ